MPPKIKKVATEAESSKTAPKKLSAASKLEEALAALRLQRACFDSKLLTPELTEHLNFIVVGDRNENGATELLPASAPVAPNQVRIFSCFLEAGLVPPFSDFFLQIMVEYRLLMMQLHPNAVTVMVVFAHFCENFLGVLPFVPLFWHFYIPRIENKNISGSVTWHLRNSMGLEFIEGHYQSRWEEWRHNWCVVKISTRHACYDVPQGPAHHSDLWKEKGPRDEDFDLVYQRIKALWTTGLTAEMVVADYSWRRITPP